MRNHELGKLVADLSEEEAGNICGGSTVVGPAPPGLVQLLEDPDKDAPGLTAEKGRRIASNTNGQKKGWITGVVPNH